MEVGVLNSKSAEVNGTKPKSLRYRRAECLTDSKRAEQGLILTRLLKSFMGVFRNDFAAVDFREELCYHSRPEKANLRGVKQFAMMLLCIFLGRVLMVSVIILDFRMRI